ncbi:hypothetical protein AK830_g5114 [Neonectria ditissima]|uniref:Uncharacterized protein n=1 Tax=Neonectria ditissima TaxID=78410 RepID=A0A0P7BLJ1_9HYPO|nr:hypothetical protein AK830_g5114 [Neonectria ditissima]
MSDSLTPLMQPLDGSIRYQMDDTFVVLSAGTFLVPKSLLVATKQTTGRLPTVLIFADVIELTTQIVDASSCNVGLFCRSFSLGSNAWAVIKTTGEDGASVDAETAAVTWANNGKDAGSISVYIEEYNPDVLAPSYPSDSGRKGLFLEAYGGNGGCGANNVTGSNNGAGTVGGNGGNGGKISFYYVTDSSSLLGSLQSTYTDKNRSFRARAQTLQGMAKDATVTAQADALESSYQALSTLCTTLDRIKNIFGAIVPAATRTAMQTMKKAANDVLTLVVEPRFDESLYATAMTPLTELANTIVKTSVDATTSTSDSWTSLAKDLALFQTALQQINPNSAQFSSDSDSPPFDAALEMFMSQIQIQDGNLQNSLFASYRGIPGAGGAGGAGANGGKAGEGGADGMLGTPTVSEYKPANPDLSIAVPYVHPDQCQLLLDVANRTYLAASYGAEADPDRFEPARKLYEAIRHRLSFVPLLVLDDVKASPEGALTSALLSLRSQGLCLDPVGQLQNIRDQAQAYLRNICYGSDMFGHQGSQEDDAPLTGGVGNYKRKSKSKTGTKQQAAARWTPRLNCTQYYDAVKQSLPNLLQLYNAIQAQQGKQQDANFNSSMCMAGIEAHITTLQQQIDLATTNGGTLDAAGSQIEQYTPALKSMRRKIQSQVDQLADSLNGSWNINPTDILSGIAQFAANPSGLTAASSIFSGLYTAASTVQASDGTDANKAYVVTEFLSAGSTLDQLSEAVQMTASGTINPDDAGAAKLLADEQTLQDLVNQFQTALDPSNVSHIRASLQAYASLAKRRNAAVLQYNVTLVMLVKAQADVVFYNAQNALLSSSVIMAAQNQASPILLQLKALDAMRATIYELLYDSNRSMQFWTVDSDASSKPPQPSSNYSDVALVESYLDSINQQFTTWYNEMARDPINVFPPPKDRDVGGIAYFLSDDLVKAFQTPVSDRADSSGEKEYQILFAIPCPTSRSNNTSGSLDYNPFVGYTNVRLDQVLVWLFGAAVQPNKDTNDCVLTLNISQLGDDTITDDSGLTTLQFQHSAVQLKFAYDPTNVTNWAAAKNTEPKIVQNLDSGGKGVGRNSVKSARQMTIAPIGPFATWVLTVSERENDGLDLSKLTGICLEFWGSAQSGPP